MHRLVENESAPSPAEMIVILLHRPRVRILDTVHRGSWKDVSVRARDETSAPVTFSVYETWWAVLET